MPPFRLNRTLDGISAVLLPYQSDGRPDLAGWAALLENTWSAGLTPAVNMDTGYANLLTAAERAHLLELTRQAAHGRRFVAGAFIEGEVGEPIALYTREVVAIQAAGGTPILFPCSTLKHLERDALVAVFREVGRAVPEFLGFELGEMFAPFGRIWDTEIFRALLEIPQLVGAKHSSLSRELEWERLAVRDVARPDFHLYTGNDLAIDLVQWGSDYLLGLSAFHVEAFAARDRWFGAGDERWRTVNDWLQYLGMLAFRAPVPAYKHTCAQFLHLRGRIATSETHPQGARRPDTDLPLLEAIRQQLDQLIAPPPEKPPEVPTN